MAALSGEVRAVDRVSGEYGIACLWLPTAMRQLTRARAEHVAQAVDRPRLVRALGIDEHRFRSVRWYRDDEGKWQRIEPAVSRMTTFTNLATGCRGDTHNRSCR